MDPETKILGYFWCQCVFMAIIEIEHRQNLTWKQVFNAKLINKFAFYFLLLLKIPYFINHCLKHNFDQVGHYY